MGRTASTAILVTAAAGKSGWGDKARRITKA
jgi:hypothetical protein